MPRVTIDHMEKNEKLGKLSITGTVDDDQAACIVFETELEGLKSAERRLHIARKLVGAKVNRPPLPGKTYIEVEHGSGQGAAKADAETDA